MEICKMKKLKDLLKESHVWERKFGEKLPTLADVQKKKNEGKLTEASYSSKEVKGIIWDMRDYVDKLVKQGEDYSIFQSAKSSARALKKIQKLLKQVG